MAKTALFEQAVVVQDLRFLKDRTIYNRIGDLVAWLSLAVTAAALLSSSHRLNGLKSLVASR